ncbi:MAG: TetR/AcrR family transcriptional regulator [[Clostridium] scindens]
MRIVKEANERKNEILDAAAALFAQKGFDHTSTSEIMEAVGIAKGTLYHHFKSKESIMDAIIERQSRAYACCSQEDGRRSQHPCAGTHAPRSDGAEAGRRARGRRQGYD